MLADYQVRQIHVDLSPPNGSPTNRRWTTATSFCRPTLSLGSLEGWNRFVMLSARSVEGRRAMRAHRDTRRIAHATLAKLRALGLILANHPGAKAVIFTEDNATAYEVSQRFLIPCLTHQTAVKERQAILDHFKSGIFTAIVTSNVLNEGVDVPDASIGVILSGSASAREFVQRLGRILRRGDGKNGRCCTKSLPAKPARSGSPTAAARRRTPPARRNGSKPRWRCLDLQPPLLKWKGTWVKRQRDVTTSDAPFRSALLPQARRADLPAFSATRAMRLGRTGADHDPRTSASDPRELQAALWRWRAIRPITASCAASPIWR
ncbi:MAG: helicase-related protein [Candidatus Competibacteraceae bacterium]